MTETTVEHEDTQDETAVEETPESEAARDEAVAEPETASV